MIVLGEVVELVLVELVLAVVMEEVMEFVLVKLVIVAVEG